MPIKILNIISEYSKEASNILGNFAEVDYLKPTQAELLNIISDYEAVVTTLGYVFNDELLSKASKLKFIGTATTGLDHIDLVKAKERGIEIISLRGEDEFLNTITGTAELAFALIFCLYRKIYPAIQDVLSGHWRTSAFRGHNLYGKTLGIIGLGRLGKLMAGYGKAFNMNIVFTDPSVSNFEGAKKVTLDELLTDSDIISIHAHLNKETENMIGEKEFGIMKKSAVIINTSRGKIVDEKSILKALETKTIAGYATDVLAGELDFKGEVANNDPLIQYAKENDNLIITPHIGGMTEESRVMTDIKIAEKILNYLKKSE